MAESRPVIMPTNNIMQEQKKKVTFQIIEVRGDNDSDGNDSDGNDGNDDSISNNSIDNHHTSTIDNTKWYSEEEIMAFRIQAKDIIVKRILSKKRKRGEEGADGTTTTTSFCYTSSTSTQPQHQHHHHYHDQHQEEKEEEDDEEDMTGLERFCQKRSASKKSARYYVIHSQLLNRDPEFIRCISRQCTEGARILALKQAYIDFCQVYSNQLLDDHLVEEEEEQRQVKKQRTGILSHAACCDQIILN